jgi:uncharacterized membrane protein YfcA
MTWNDILLCGTALAAGIINAVAGGGTLLTFPALYTALGPRYGTAEAGVHANGTSTMALWPGSLGSFWAYRREFREAGGWVWRLLLPCAVGGLIGVLLVTELSPKVFDALVPWLIFSAALLFAFQPQIRRLTGIGKKQERPRGFRLAAMLVCQFLVSIYGGYFGAGAGILMLAVLGMMGLSDIHVMNAVKTLYIMVINIMASIVFIIRGKVDWRLAIPMLIAGTIGGYLGAVVARRINPTIVRRAVVVIGFGLAAYYFYKRSHG